ncbi:MAG: hypothetical protein C9356_02185 [Oleiphilus sp.]|nr:MAG: hypothetical protein C9356_02185 [Oleiphilus sp.]
MWFQRVSVLLVLALAIGGCSGGSGGGGLPSEKPEIAKIYTDIYHAHTSFFDKWEITPNATIRFTVSASITDPQGVDNIKNVFVVDLDQDWYWTLLGGSRNIPLSDCYYELDEIFECVFHMGDNSHSVNLRGYALVVEDWDGNEATKQFDFLNIGGDPLDTEQFAYSDEFTGSTDNGLPGLEAMTIDENDLVFTSNPATQSFHIEFETSDSRAAHYGFAFYEGSSELDYIGDACLCAPSIESMPIVFGQTTRIDLPWSEIDFKPGYQAEDVFGVHIKLYDEPIAMEHPKMGGLWFNYISYSEFLPL